MNDIVINWKQCYQCGSIFAVYEIENEASIKDVVETIDNPNDIGKNEFLAVDFRNKRKRLQKKFDDEIKDDDLKSELASGEFIK